jgi:GNAT superfamily N-acetyltransferase
MKSCRPLEDSILCNISAYNHLYSEPSHPAARLLSKIYISKKTCYIEDITSIYQRRGLGSFLLKMLEDLMRLLNVEKIIGWLSPVDLKNRDIQVAFYLSNGFELNLPPLK